MSGISHAITITPGRLFPHNHSRSFQRPQHLIGHRRVVALSCSSFPAISRYEGAASAKRRDVRLSSLRQVQAKLTKGWLALARRHECRFAAYHPREPLTHSRPFDAHDDLSAADGHPPSLGAPSHSVIRPARWRAFVDRVSGGGSTDPLELTGHACARAEHQPPRGAVGHGWRRGRRCCCAGKWRSGAGGLRRR